QASLMTTPVAPGSGGFVFFSRQKTNPISAPQLSRQPGEIQAGIYRLLIPATVVSWRLWRNANKLVSLSPVESIMSVFVMSCLGL
ncbi:hypothetical protein, partial [Burkholderia sp. ISTR5]|uniref:hypothetical protein n=1 Tax=Burkholderia sp. ISTR5 TaxID=2500161 RepID=UPI001F18A6F3